MTKDIRAKINEFTKLIKQYPHVQELYVHRAILYEKSKQYQKAVEDYKRYHLCIILILIWRVYAKGTG